MKHFLSQFLRLSLLSLCLVSFGFGCKGLSQTQQEAVRPVVLNYWTVYDNVPKLQEFAEAYKQIRPYVTVNIRQVRADVFDETFVTALADDVAPDIISLSVDSLGKHIRRLSPMPSSVKVSTITVSGTISPQTTVTTFNNPMPTKTDITRDYVSTVPADVIIGGNIYGLPLAIDTLGLFYNRTLLDRAGVPQPPATWDDFLDAVKKSTKFTSTGEIAQSGVALGVGTNIDNNFDLLSLLFLQNGVTPGRGNAVQFANGVAQSGENHPALQALRFYTDFAIPTKDVYSWNGKMEGALDAFVHGKSVFYFGFARDRASFRSRAPQLDIQVIPVPQLHPDAPANVASYSIESVVGKSKHQNEAWDFIRFITSPENTRKYVEATGQPSPLRSHIADQQKDVNLAPFVSQVLFAKHWYTGGDIIAARKAFADLVEAYKLPLGPREQAAERNANLLLRTQQTVQQTY